MMDEILTRPIPRARCVFCRFQISEWSLIILRDGLVHHLPIDIGESDVATAGATGEFFVIEAESCGAIIDRAAQAMIAEKLRQDLPDGPVTLLERFHPGSGVAAGRSGRGSTSALRRSSDGKRMVSASKGEVRVGSQGEAK